MEIRDLYQGAMEVARTYGKPRLFITCTCNPSWPEIKESWRPNQTSNMRPGVTSRVYLFTIDALMGDIYANGALGRPAPRLYFIEFHQRWLPHAHILCTLSDDAAPRYAANYNNIVSALIPGREKEPALWRTITTSMMRGPCGALNPKST